MKKVLFFAMGLFLVGVMASCKKDHTCECKFSDGTGTLTAEFENVTKSDAEDACDALERTYKIGDPSASCSLK